MTNSEKMIRALEEQDLDLAQAYFLEAIQKDDDGTLYDLGLYLESHGFYDHAREIFLQLVSECPELYLNLAQIANEDGEVEKAFTYLDQFSEDSPFYLEALVVKADLYQSEGLADVAREKLLEALALSDEPILVFGLAELDMELGNFQEAIQGYAQLDNREIYEETGVSTYQRIGLAYASLGKFEAAIEFLEKAVELEYDDQTVYELATLLFDQGSIRRPIFISNSWMSSTLTLRAMNMPMPSPSMQNTGWKRRWQWWRRDWQKINLTRPSYSWPPNMPMKTMRLRRQKGISCRPKGMQKTSMKLVCASAICIWSRNDLKRWSAWPQRSWTMFWPAGI